MIKKIPNNLDMFSSTAQQQLDYIFRRLNMEEKRRFEGVQDVANSYQDVINNKINTRKKIDNPINFASLAKKTK